MDRIDIEGKTIKLSLGPMGFALARQPSDPDWCVALPLGEMALWLAAQGYAWITGSNGLWARAGASHE